MIPADSLIDAVKKLSAPRVVWLMLQARPTEQASPISLRCLSRKTSSSTVATQIITIANAEAPGCAARHSVYRCRHLRCVWGLENGYCLMVGGDKAAVAVLEPVLKALARRRIAVGRMSGRLAPGISPR